MKKLLLFLIIVLSGCATTKFDLHPINLENEHQVILYDGKELVISKLEKTDIVVFGGIISANDLAIHVYVKNKSNEPINVYPGKITVFGRNDKNIMWAFKNVDYREYMAKIQRQQSLALALLGLAGALQAQSAGYATTTTNIFDSKGNSISAVSNTYDASKQAAAANQNAAQINMLAQCYQNTNAQVNTMLLKSNTLFPEMEIEGIVIFEINSLYTQKIVLSVNLDDEIHRIEFEPTALRTY